MGNRLSVEITFFLHTPIAAASKNAQSTAMDYNFAYIIIITCLWLWPMKEIFAPVIFSVSVFKMDGLFICFKLILLIMMPIMDDDESDPKLIIWLMAHFRFQHRTDTDTGTTPVRNG